MSKVVKNSLIVIAIAILVFVIIYFVYDLLKAKPTYSEQVQQSNLEGSNMGIDTDKLVQLVLDGKKTATTSLYELDNVSKVGDISILTDLKDNNVCFIKTINVIITEFKNITWDLAELEGENKSLNEWKESHMNYFNIIDPNFNENTKVIFEVFSS